MGKSIILLIILLCASPSWGRMNVAMMGGGAEVGGCSKGTTIISETFESIADGEEWSNDGNWVETPGTTNVFVGDNARAHGGSLSGLITAYSNGYIIHNDFSEVTTGKLTADIWIAVGSVGATLSDILLIGDGALGTAGNLRVEFSSNASGELQIVDNLTAVAVLTQSANTFNHIEIEIDTAITTGIDAVRVWVNGTEHASSPFDTRARANPAGIDRIGAYTDASAAYWWDDVLIYSGERCEY